jgi:hypothetical protein
MKRLLAALFLALVASLALAVNLASATPGNAQGPKTDLAAGTGQTDFFGSEIKVHVNAQSGPSGEDPRGHFSYQAVDPSLDFEISGRVTCLNVVGNRAVVGGVVERSNDPSFPAGEGVLIFIVDDDKGAGDGFFAVATDTPETCPPPPPFEPPFPTNQGNWVVHDAMP